MHDLWDVTVCRSKMAANIFLLVTIEQYMERNKQCVIEGGMGIV